MTTPPRPALVIILGAAALLMAGVVQADPPERFFCNVPDDGTGTGSLPPVGCSYIGPGPEVFMIIDGLPPGTTIELDPLFSGFACLTTPCEQPGGFLGGTVAQFEATLRLEVDGTGDLAGFQRTIEVPVLSEIHTAPRFPGQSVQTFATDLFSFQGVLPPGDPDLSQLLIIAGTNNALPSPGLASMRDRPGSAFSVDSFFDISYQIDFVGAPGGALEGLAGSTTATVRLAVERPPLPAGVCEGVDNGSGTTDLPPSACRYTNREEPFEIVDGLPPGTTMELSLVQSGFVCDSMPCGQPGGDLGGETEAFDSQMVFELKGTGSLLGYTRTLTLQGDQENHSAPRTPGDPVQHFETLVSSWTASLMGDPDFSSLSFTAGNAQGLTSPGMTTLTDVGSGTFVVDSFFDITYQIDFEGAPGGVLDGLSGSTRGRAGIIAGVPDIFVDGFESGNTTAWTSERP